MQLYFRILGKYKLMRLSSRDFIADRVLRFVASATFSLVRILDLLACRFANGLGESAILRVPPYIVLQDHRGEDNASGARRRCSPHHLDLEKNIYICIFIISISLLHIIYQIHKVMKIFHLRFREIGRFGNRVNAILVESGQGIRKQLEVTDAGRKIIRRVLRVHRERETCKLLQSLVRSRS